MGEQQRASLRHGLPYGWWRREGFWAGVVTLGSVAFTGGLLVLVVAAWWGLA